MRAKRERVYLWLAEQKNTEGKKKRDNIVCTISQHVEHWGLFLNL